MMTPAASKSIRDLGLSRQELALRIQQILAPVGELEGISIDLLDDRRSTFSVLRNGKFILQEVSPVETRLAATEACPPVTVDGGTQILVRGSESEPATVRLISALLRGALRVAEAERREELLLEELGENWERLEALYEISTDALQFGNTTDALRRLMERLTSIRKGLRSALFIRREGTYHPLAGTGEELRPLHASQLGPVEKAVREMQIVLINELAPSPDRQPFWRDATSLAVAPFAWEGSAGFVAVWSEDVDCKFDSSVSRMLESITYQASVMMQRERLLRKVRESELLAQEVEIASSIQQTLLLASPPTDASALEFAACSIPSQRIDGDFHDFFQHPDHTVDVLIGDVMGKGVAAALLGAATKSQFLRAMANLALQSGKETPRPVDIVTRAASRLSNRLISLDRFVTLSYARFDPVNRKLIFVDCGHTTMVRESTSRGGCSFLHGDDLPLGVLPDFRCEEHSVEFHPGETFLLYSDGVTESRSPSGELFGAERLAECVQNWSALGPKLLVEQIRKEATRFTQSEKFSDDFTCVAVRIKVSERDEAPVASRSAIFPCDSSSIAGFREWLCECAGLLQNPLTEDDIARLQLACVEIFANCAIHLHDDPDLQPVKVESTVFANHISVQISHFGPPWDPFSCPVPAFDGSRDSGFGLYIVLRSADEASFDRLSGGTNVTTLSFLRTDMEHPL